MDIEELLKSSGIFRHIVSRAKKHKKVLVVFSDGSSIKGILKSYDPRLRMIEVHNDGILFINLDRVNYIKVLEEGEKLSQLQ